MAGNVVAGGIIGIGIGVDAVTGAAFDHYPNPVNIVLEPDGVPQVPIVTAVTTSTTQKTRRSVPTF